MTEKWDSDQQEVDVTNTLRRLNSGSVNIGKLQTTSVGVKDMGTNQYGVFYMVFFMFTFFLRYT